MVLQEVLLKPASTRTNVGLKHCKNVVLNFNRRTSTRTNVGLKQVWGITKEWMEFGLYSNQCGIETRKEPAKDYARN